MGWTMVDEVNEIDCRMKEIKSTWSIKCGLKEMTWDMNNEVWNKGNYTKHENEVENVTTALFDTCQSDYRIHSKLTIFPLF